MKSHLHNQIVIKPPLLYWRPILENWVLLNEEIFKASRRKFAAYSYRERPNVGVIASAGVKAGWTALEECWSEKKDDPDCVDVYHGRADLWLWKGKYHERIEAKFTTDDIPRLIKKIRKRHEAAKEAARKLARISDANNIALTFVVPRKPAGDNRDFGNGLPELIDYCKGLAPCLFGSVFPGEVPRLGGDKNDKDMVACGVIVVGDIV